MISYGDKATSRIIIVSGKEILTLPLDKVENKFRLSRKSNAVTPSMKGAENFVLTQCEDICCAVYGYVWELTRS
jgi:hypothetical protein